MPNADILEFLFATVATIVATVTGLIGAFATFRLQNISSEIGFLKGYVLAKKVDETKTLNDYIKGEYYHLLEKIYDRNLEGISILENVTLKHNLHRNLDDLMTRICHRNDSTDLQSVPTNKGKLKQRLQPSKSCSFVI
ncbi:hypothetical protein [Flavobacterium sp. Arc2]|uniref:hypothetical protein n=1 Tax=Flavobacterium sp. Arc2 TaxID=3046685 RepID=UPI00352F7535